MNVQASAPHSEIQKASRVSLKGFYWIGVLATSLGILIVFLLNVATPLNLVFERIIFLFDLSPIQQVIRGLAFFAVVAGSCFLSYLAVYGIMKPIRVYLGRLGAEEEPALISGEAAKRRLINLPFLFIPVSIGLWILIPFLVFVSLFFSGVMDFRTGMVFAVRAAMVGLVASSIGFYALEAHARRTLIPLFFPHGHLTSVKGAARISISRRIRMFYRLGSLTPLAILIVTLITLQMEVDDAVVTAEAYGRGIIRFTVVLGVVFFVTAGVLNRMVSRSIVNPIRHMLEHVNEIRDGNYDVEIRVVGNDEIGILGDAGNAMIQGLSERETIRQAFGKYVTPEIRDEILAGNIPLEGERREGTVLFADLRGFTRYVEIHPPEEVIAGMRGYFTAMHRAVRRHGGLVLQFVGDELECVFGVPVYVEDHADRALRAALDMREALDAFNRDRAAAGKDTFSHGIGIHSGLVLAGNSGSEEQSAYALIGDTVNIASRIQGLTKELHCDILASRETMDRVTTPCSTEDHGPRMVKGYSKSVTVYRIIERSFP